MWPRIWGFPLDNSSLLDTTQRARWKEHQLLSAEDKTIEEIG
jgi:hypothetical protein